MRVRYTLPFWWICLVLARWGSTGCIAGISVAWIPSQLAMSSAGCCRILGAWNRCVLPPSFCFLSFSHTPHSPTALHSESIITSRLTDHRATEKFDHLGVGTARAAFSGLHSSLSHRVERCIHSPRLQCLASRFSLTD
ncbi:hypothetical protein F5144DRAFT_146000 [Chaetomium tenue]|uniref:Uncharacterized protein n=1 Tax=Chaetomium tenue TaxID=1854479 RepID=A0ACB7PJN7_9PEZI|nr:hypothetical protein F5144DRAFT_146000 [Chaetomium globosum]